MTVHSFAASLNESQRHADAPWWEQAYRAAFPDLEACVSVRSDGWAQRGGIDRKLVLASGRHVTIDEKVRTVDRQDFALEYWSDHARRVPGWVAKDLACDYIAYAFVPSGRCYLLPFHELRRAWRANRREWVRAYRDPKRHIAHNRENGRGWETHFVPVPIPVVMEALADAMLVHFDPLAGVVA